MKSRIKLKEKGLLHNWVFWLILITGIAIIIRSIPAWLNAAWGVDFGIYYGLTNSFIQTSEFINIYDGWGDSYQYFPVLYTITGGLHWITGIDIIELLPKIAPIFGGLTIPIFYFIVKDLIKDKKIALISSAILAVSILHIYQTSHAAPLTIGHFFMMISLYFFLKYQKNPMFSIPLVLSTVLLILSHHFTTYFFILTITFLTFAYVSKRKKITRQAWYILAYVFFASTAAFSYWIFVAKPVYQGFMSSNFFLPAWAIVGLYYILVVTSLFTMTKWDKINPLNYIKLNFFDMNKYKKIALAFCVALGLLIIVSITGLPGVYIRITPLAIIYSVPTILILSLSYAGLSYLKSLRNGFLIKGWFIGIFLSLLYSLTSAKLLPDRHLEYLIVPLCIPAALTIIEIIKDHPIKWIKEHTVASIEHIESHKYFKRNILAVVLIALLFVANLLSAYPAIDSLNAIDERVSDNCINTLDWMKGNVSNTSVFASDHRLEMLAWAEGFKITQGTTNCTWYTENLTDYKDELIELNVTHIIIDDIMRYKVVNVDVGKYYYMTNESYDKFNSSPFELIYRNETLNDEFEEIHWVEIYQVNRSLLMKDE